LDHRLGRLLRGYGIRVTVHYLPLTTFGSKDHRSPQSVWGDVLAPTYLGLGPLYLHNVGQLQGRILRYDLGADKLSIAA
jgi:hypothetical protein